MVTINYTEIYGLIAQMVSAAFPVAIAFAIVAKLVNMFMSMAFNGRIDL